MIDLVVKRLEKIKKEVDSIAKDAVKKESQLISDLNRGQLREGKTALGTDMPKYVQNSRAPKAPGTIKLFDTGAYTKGISPLFSDKGIDMTSTDQKVKFLGPKYPIALGLSDASLEILKESVIDDIQKELLEL